MNKITAILIIPLTELITVPNTMKKYFLILVLPFFLTILESCSTSVNINDYIDKNLPIKLIINKTDSVIYLTDSNIFLIPVNSEKYEKIIQWGNENTNGWRTTYASYITNFMITQNKFRLLRINCGVVISFTDKNGKPRQYIKTVNEDELKFLSDY